ncbi:MAG: DUF3098 domain-containing protein [Muribaculaceae bacterium]|nr:DUF3098 domain-containing protein [Muribaculaceae bacterium]
MATPQKKNYNYAAGRRTAPIQASEAKKGVIAESEQDKPLLRNNFLLVIIAGVMIILGFILISGSPTGIDEYNPDIYSTRRIVVGPTIAFLGFVLMAIAIIVKPKSGKKSNA